MRRDERDPRRSIPVRLCDISIDVRLRAAREAARREVDSDGRQELLMAALFPSQETYWIRPGAEVAA